MKNKVLIAGLFAAAALPALAHAQPYAYGPDPGCVQANHDSRVAGTVVGGVTGAALGAIIGGRNAGAGALIGGGLGAVAGNQIASNGNQPCPAGYVYEDPRPGYGGDRFWRDAPEGIHDRIDFVQHRIDVSLDRGWIGPRDADRLSGQLNDIRREDRHMRDQDYGDLRPVDRDYLQGRLDDVSQQLHWAADR